MHDRQLALAVNPQTNTVKSYDSCHQVRNSIFAKSESRKTRETKNRAQARRSLHAGKVPNGVRWKNLLRRYRVRRLREIRFVFPFPGAGEGIRTPDPLITNQMLYRLSYASTSRDRCAFAQTYPSDPFKMSGTINQVITSTIYPATAGTPRARSASSFPHCPTWAARIQTWLNFLPIIGD